MKKIIVFVLCFLAMSFTFAEKSEKKEFIADDEKAMGVIEFASNDVNHLCSYTQILPLPESTKAKMLQSTILLQFNSETSARKMYEDSINVIKSYNDFLNCINMIRNIPEVSAMESTRVTENNVIYDIKTIDMHQ